jgi:hypothetical protein
MRCIRALFDLHPSLILDCLELFPPSLPGYALDRRGKPLLQNGD